MRATANLKLGEDWAFKAAGFFKMAFARLFEHELEAVLLLHDAPRVDLREILARLCEGAFRGSSRGFHKTL